MQLSRMLGGQWYSTPAAGYTIEDEQARLLALLRNAAWDDAAVDGALTAARCGSGWSRGWFVLVLLRAMAEDDPAAI